MNPKTKICTKCNASFVPEKYNSTEYCNNCLKRSLKQVKIKKPHFFVEDEIMVRKFYKNETKNTRT